MIKGYLAVEIATTRIRFTYLVKTGRQYAVSKAGSLLYALNVASPGDLKRMVLDLVKREDLQPSRIFVTISRPEALLRQVVLPKLNSKELEEVIPGEIEKIPPFFQKKYDYICHCYPMTKEKIRVVYAAIEQSLLDYIFSEIKSTGIPFNHFEISPLNLKELIYLLKPAGKNHALLVINDRMSHFVIFKDHEYRLIYKLGIGIEQLYPKSNGPLEQETFGNLIAEVQRVLRSYLGEYKQDPIDQLWLVWDQLWAPQFAMSLRNQLEARIEVLPMNFPQLDPAATPALQNSVNVISVAPVIFELTKLQAQFAFDHFFRGLHFKKYILSAALSMMVYLAVVGGALTLVTHYFHSKENELKEKMEEVVQKTETLQIESKDLMQKKERYLSVRQGLLEQATYVKMLNRISWSQVLSVVAARMPEGLCLTSFRFDESGRASFNGEAFQMEPVSELIRRVDHSSILENGRFDFLRETRVENQKLFAFGILAQLKLPPAKTDE